MIRKVLVRPAARSEILMHAQYLRDAASDLLVQRFLGSLDDGSDHSLLREVRKYALNGFPNHLIFYRFDAHVLDVLHVFHGMRDIESLLGGDNPDDDEE